MNTTHALDSHSEGRVMNLQLRVVAGPDQGRSFDLLPGEDLLLGRSADAYYHVSDPDVSRNHCQLVAEDDGVVVVCNGHGTFVNGIKIDRKKMLIGDSLLIGKTKMQLVTAEVPSESESTPASATVNVVEEEELEFEVLEEDEEDFEVVEEVAEAEPAVVTEEVFPDDPAELARQTFSHFRVGDLLGEGPTGLVFEARDTKDEVRVALKVLRPELTNDDATVQRFVRAMKTLLPLRAAHLVTIRAAGKTGPFCWMAMEYVQGKDMGRVIKAHLDDKPLGWKYAFRVAVQTARALHFCHRHHIVHGTVVPSNILKNNTTKEVKLCDLLLARVVTGPEDHEGTPIDRLAYLAPERTYGPKHAEPRSDLYGLGATLYALLTARPPFEGDTRKALIKRVRNDEPEWPTLFEPSIPRRLEGVVMRLMDKQPQGRHASAAALLNELERIGQEEEVEV